MCYNKNPEYCILRLKRAGFARIKGKAEMKVIGKKGLTGVTEIVITVLMVCDLGVIGSMPWWLEAYLDIRTSAAHYYNRYFVLLFASGLLAEILMWQARRLMHNINNIGPFIMDNAKLLKKIGLCCVAISLGYFVAVPFLPSFFVIIIAMAFAVVAVLCFVFAELFRQAVVFKQDNELTI